MWNDHWGCTELEECCITKFKRAQVRGGEVVLSQAYDRVKSRFSHFVTVEWPEQGLFVAKIKCFVKVELADDNSPVVGQGSPQRYAIADLYKQSTPSQASQDVGQCLMATKKQQLKPSFADYPVNVEDIRSKVLWADVSVSPDVSGQQGLPSGAWLFAQYPHFTVYVDPQADIDSNSNDGSEVSDQDDDGVNE